MGQFVQQLDLILNNTVVRKCATLRIILLRNVMPLLRALRKKTNEIVRMYVNVVDTVKTSITTVMMKTYQNDSRRE